MAYDVVVEARVRKTIRIEEDVDEQTAVEFAHERFSILNDGLPEDYNEDTISIEKVEED